MLMKTIPLTWLRKKKHDNSHYHCLMYTQEVGGMPLIGQSISVYQNNSFKLQMAHNNFLTNVRFRSKVSALKLETYFWFSLGYTIFSTQPWG